MKKPLLLFALKCSVIVYFAACTNIQNLADQKSVSHLLTKGNWQVNCFSNTTADNTCDFKGYTFSFNAAGSVSAVKDGKKFNGNWIEDNISKKITIHFITGNTVLNELNDYWNITDITNAGISFEKTTNKETEKFYITAL